MSKARKQKTKTNLSPGSCFFNRKSNVLFIIKTDKWRLCGYRRARLSALISHTGKLTPQFLPLDSVKFHQNVRKRVHHHLNSVSVACWARLTRYFCSAKKENIFGWIFCFTDSKMQFLILSLVPFSNKKQALLSHFILTANMSLGTCHRHLPLGPPPKINVPIPLLIVTTQLISCLFRDGRLFSSSQCVNKHTSCACQAVSRQFSRLCFTSSQRHSANISTQHTQHKGYCVVLNALGKHRTAEHMEDRTMKLIKLHNYSHE